MKKFISLKWWCTRSKFTLWPSIRFPHRLAPKVSEAVRSAKNTKHEIGRSFFTLQFNWLLFELRIYLPIETTPVIDKMRYLSQLENSYTKQIKHLAHKRTSVRNGISELQTVLNFNGENEEYGS